MSGKKLEYAFVAFPAELHPLWLGVSTHDMGLCLRLFILTKGDPYPIHGRDWMGWLCRQMTIHGPERRNVRAALARYHDLGLIKVESGVVTVGFRPDFVLGPTSDQRPTDVRSTVDRQSIDSARTSLEHRSDVARVVKIEPSTGNHSSQNLQIDQIRSDQIREDEDARARATTAAESQRGFRRPLPEPPLGFAEREPAQLSGQALATWILRQHASRYHARFTVLPKGTKLEEMARRVAEWVEGSRGAYGLSNQELAGKLLDGLFASDKARDAKNPYGLGWLVNGPEEFCGRVVDIKKAREKQERERQQLEARRRHEASLPKDEPLTLEEIAKYSRQFMAVAGRPLVSA